MKRFVLPLILTLAFTSFQAIPAHAGLTKTLKAKISADREYKNTKNEIKEIFALQDKFTNEHKIEGLNGLYSENFTNSDGFSRTLYFKLIQDTWETYPEIVYNTILRDIQIDGNYATVQTFETALATTHELSEKVDAFGELRSYSNSIYHLEKIGSKWKIVSEQILSEKSQLKYGDARFINMDLSAPHMVVAGKDYTATLDIQLSDDESAIASIDNQLIIYPLDKPQEAFRNLTGESELERVFKANAKNINEYATASIGIAKTERSENSYPRVYVSGIAFLMTRVNVIPENKFITEEDKNAQKTK